MNYEYRLSRISKNIFDESLWIWVSEPPSWCQDQAPSGCSLSRPGLLDVRLLLIVVCKRQGAPPQSVDPCREVPCNQPHVKRSMKRYNLMHIHSNTKIQNDARTTLYIKENKKCELFTRISKPALMSRTRRPCTLFKFSIPGNSEQWHSRFDYGVNFLTFIIRSVLLVHLQACKDMSTIFMLFRLWGWPEQVQCTRQRRSRT